jgi:hypothetical protein
VHTKYHIPISSCSLVIYLFEVYLILSDYRFAAWSECMLIKDELERRRSRPSVTYCLGISPQELRKTTKRNNLSHVSQCLLCGSDRRLLNTRFQYHSLITHISCRYQTEAKMYKVVQIWPGQTVTCWHTNNPGHIWTTLYFIRFLCCWFELKNYYLPVSCIFFDNLPKIRQNLSKF